MSLRRISDDPDIMAILRSGYDTSKKVPKVNTNSLKQEWYFTYCLKIIIGEKSPSKLKAKGLLDRTLLFSVFPGDSELDIKEVTNQQESDSRLQEALAELLDFRKLMLVYRLIHFNDSIPDLDIGVKRRNKELCKPYIRLFYGSQAQTEVEQTFQTFLDAKSDKKSTSLEAILIPVIIGLVEEKGNEVLSKDIWDFIKENLEGETDPYDPNGYHVSGYTLYRNTVTKLLEDKFGASYKHTDKGGKITFNDDKLQKVQKSYDAEAIIKTKLSLKADGTDGTDGILEKASDKIKNNYAQNEAQNYVKIPQAQSQEPSEPSEPSGSSPSATKLSKEEKAELLRKYDASQKRIKGNRS